jgi:osmotically-inducible protein OsmY
MPSFQTVLTTRRSGRASAIAALALTAAIATAGSGCARATPPATRPTAARGLVPVGVPLGDPASVAPPAATDTWIVAVLLRELDGDDVVAREHVDVDCANGVLTLRGEVGDRLAKQRAVAIAQVVRGVRAIVDRISVVPRPRPDYELEFVAAGALANDPTTAGQAIGAHARAGVVHLAGNADSNAARQIAENDILATPGVVDVVDDLAVVQGKRGDAQLRSEVERVMRDDPWLDDARVRVAVEDGVVEITGIVKSAAERGRAEGDARATSPRGVDVVALRINAVSDGTWRDQPAAARTDEELARAYVDAVARDPRVHPFLPGIQVRDRVVVITGEAPDVDAAQAAADDARNLPGVADTHVDVRVAPAVGESDRAVLYQARGAIEHDPHLSSRHIAVEVFHGRVSLRGSVGSEADRRRAIAAVTSVPGARGVDDDLVVDPPTLGSSLAHGTGR